MKRLSCILILTLLAVMLGCSGSGSNPALPGEPVFITAKLKNTGVVHAHDVQVRFSVNSLEFYTDSIDLLAGASEATTVIDSVKRRRIARGTSW